MKYTISLLIVICLFLTGQSFADPAEAEFQNLKETWILRENGSQEYRCYKELTLFTHTAMNSTYGETFITYNPEFQKLKIHASYTKQKDGTIVQTPANAFIEVLPRQAEKAPAYNHLKEMVIVHTGLELGATIYLDYSILSEPGYLPEINICRELQQTSPIKEYTFSLQAPVSKTIHYATLAFTQKPVEIIKEHQREWIWKFVNLPARSQAPEVNIQNGDLPAMIVSTYPSIQEALQRLYQQFDTDPSAEITQLAKNLTKECTSDTEKLETILSYVRNQIAFCPLPLEETGYRFRAASAVLQTAYGTEAEKINLLNILLKACNLHATPFAAYGLNIAPDACGLKTMKQLVVRAEAEGKSHWLNIHNTSDASQDALFLSGLADGEKITPQSREKRIRYTATLNLCAEQQVTASIEAGFSPTYIPYFKVNPSAFISSLQDPEVNTSSTETVIKGNSNWQPKEQNGYLILSLPETNQGINHSGYAQYNSKRRNRLHVTAPLEETYQYTVELPSEIQVCTPAVNKKIENKIGELSITITPNGSTIKVYRKLKLKKAMITPEEYPDFRQLIVEWNAPNERQLLLNRK